MKTIYNTYKPSDAKAGKGYDCNLSCRDMYIS